MGDRANETPGDETAGNDAGYEIGFGKPPVHSRFQKGSSGNPKGRRPGSKNLATLFARELDSVVIVTENGKRRKKRKREVIVAQLVNKSAGADLRAIGMLLSIVDKIEHKDQAAPSAAETTAEPFDEVDARVMRDVFARFAAAENHEND
jgi:Family of unknown function (DUF5681)